MASQSDQHFSSYPQQQQMNNRRGFSYVKAVTANQPTDLNLAAREFYPKAAPSFPPQNLPLAGVMHSNSTTPSFDMYSSMPKPSHNLLDAVHTSPALTPSGSPPMQLGLASHQPSSHSLNITSALPVHQLSLQQSTQQLTRQQADLVQESIQGTTYFYAKDEYVSPTSRQTFPGYSVYTGVPSHIYHMKPNTNSQDFFLQDEIKKEILHKQAIIMSEVEGVTDIPSEVDKYCNLVPLELFSKHHVSGRFRYTHSVYKAVNQKDGLTYCLHRLHGFKLTNPKCMTVIDQWKRVSSPHIVALREVFTTKAFNDNSIVFVYDFHPTAQTLAARHFTNVSNGYSSPFNIDGSARPFSAGKGARHAGQLSESSIWSYIIQLSGALRIMHAHKLTAFGLHPTKLLVCNNKLQINCNGILDVINFDSNMSTLSQPQAEDFHSFGMIVLALACNSELAFRPEQLKASLEHVKQNYSPDLNHLIRYLISRPMDVNINQVMPMIGARFYVELEGVENRMLKIEHELNKEVENGRLFRALTKLNTILERVGFTDPSWAETGDRYLLKLFRDYVFHQTTETGAPWLDMTHIVSSLNKLDAGVQEKICLTSADETNVIIVSYQELKRCFDNAFNEIVQANVTQTYGTS